jgi:hypothetical protein
MDDLAGYKDPFNAIDSDSALSLFTDSPPPSSNSCHVHSVTFESLDRHLQNLYDCVLCGDNPGLSKALSALCNRFTTARDGCPYSPAYLELGIPSIIVAALDPNRAIADQNSAITIVTFAAYFTDPRYFQPLAEAGVVAALLEGKDFRLDDQIPYFEAFRHILSHGPHFCTQIIESVNFNALFTTLSSPQLPDEHGRAVSRFILRLCDFPLPPFLIRLFVTHIQSLIALRGLREKFTRELLQAIDGFFSVLEQNGGAAAVDEYHALLRECGFAVFLMEFAVTQWQGLTERAIFTVLHSLGHILERPVDFPVDPAVIAAWISPCQSSDVVVSALEVAGNIFEAMPETIASFAAIGFFDAVREIIGGASADVRTEALVCASTAVVFGDSSVRLSFLNENFLAPLIDSLGTGANFLGYMVADAARILFDCAVAAQGSAAALALFEAAGAMDALADADCCPASSAGALSALSAALTRAQAL